MIVLQLDRAADRIGGSFDDGRGAPLPFDGWLELGTLLEQARRWTTVPDVDDDPAPTLG